MFGHCIGARAPEVGERLIAIDTNRVLGVLRVLSVDPYNDGCQQASSWMIHTVVDSGDVHASRGTVLALADVPVDTRSAKLVTVDTSPTGHTWGTDTIFAIDGNDDGSPDVEFIQFPCDDGGNASVMAVTGQCHEVWGTRTGGGLERLRQDRFRTCY
jgi:hypothetical protein